MGEMENLFNEQMGSMGQIGEKLPETMQGFKQFMGAVEKDGALDAKTKELISLSLAVKSQCHWCIAIHVKKCLGLGATKEQVLESAMMAVLMGGGPALMYVKLVQDALDEFAQ